MQLLQNGLSHALLCSCVEACRRLHCGSWDSPNIPRVSSKCRQDIGQVLSPLSAPWSPEHPSGIALHRDWCPDYFKDELIRYSTIGWGYSAGWGCLAPKFCPVDPSGLKSLADTWSYVLLGTCHVVLAKRSPARVLSPQLLACAP
eukprot:8292635-Alexandrium_andersonii.AAC.1